MSRAYHWRLPAAMGGRVVEGKPCGWNDGELTHVEVAINGQQIPLPVSILTEIKRPQPTTGWVVTSGDKPQVFHRTVDFEPNTWWHHDQGEFVTWDMLCDYGEPSELVELKNRARCSVCHRIQPVRIDGMIKEHGARHAENRCKGSGMPPEGAS